METINRGFSRKTSEEKFDSFADLAKAVKQPVPEIPAQEIPKQEPVKNDTPLTDQSIPNKVKEEKMNTLKGTEGLIASLGRPTLSGNGTTGLLTSLKESIELAIKDSELSLLVVSDSSALGLPVVVIYQVKNGIAAYYSIIPEALVFAGSIAPIEEYINNSKILIDMPASKCYNARYHAFVSQLLLARTNATSAKPTSYYAVPKSRPLDEKSLGDIVADTANMAIGEFFEPSPLITSDILKAKNLKITLQNDIVPNSTVFFTEGVPVAVDAVIRVQASSTTTERDDPNAGGESLTLSKIGVRFDMFHQDPRSGGQYHQTNYNSNAPQPGYHPVLIIADSEGLNTESGNSIENVGTHVMGLISVAMLACGQNWLSLFTGVGTNKKNLGLVGYEHNPWSSNFTPAEIEIENASQVTKEGAMTPGQIAECYFHKDSMTIAMDIKQGGRSSWAQRIFLEIANGSATANETLKTIIDGMVGNKFKPLWERSGGGMLIRPETVIIHNGHYPAADGTDHDIREIDRLYMINLLKEQSSDATSGVGTYAQSFIPGATSGSEGLVRMHLRRLNIDLATGNSVTYTGLSERLYCAPHLLSVFTAAMVESGVQLSPEGLYDSGQQSEQLINGFVPGVAVGYNTAGQAFQSTSGINNNQNAYSHASASFY